MLDPGELAAAYNAEYMPDDPTIQRMRGRQLVLDTPSSITSLVTCKFDNGAHWVVMSGGSNTWAIARAEDLATFAGASQNTTGYYKVLPITITSSAPIQATQYNNKWYLSNGVDGPFCLLQDGSVRLAGMRPCKTDLGLATAAGAMSTTVTGFFEYWCTEVFSSTASGENAATGAPFELESNFTGHPQTVRVTSSTSQTVEIKLPKSTENDNTTHFRVYRGGSKIYQDDKVFPVGIRASKDIPIGPAVTDTSNPVRLLLATQPVTYDGSLSASSSAFYASAVVATDHLDYGATVSAIPGSATSTWASASASASASGHFVSGLERYLDLAFAWANIKDPVAGIKVEVKMRAANLGTGSGAIQRASLTAKLVDATNPGTWVYGDQAGATDPDKSQSTFYASTTNLTSETVAMGGQGQFWGAAKSKLKGSDFTPTTYLRLYLTEFGMTGSNVTKLDKGFHTHIDTVLVTVYFSGSSQTDIPFNAVILEPDAANNALISVGAADPPPAFSASTIFNGMLVTNDPKRPRHLVYSQGGYPEYVPSAYYTKLEVADHNKVTFLGVVNGRLIAGLDGALIRVNYLPTEQDTDFAAERDRVWEYISESRGVVNARCAATYVDPETGYQMLAFISSHGLFATDGHLVKKLSRNLDWTQLPASSLMLGLVHDYSTSQLWIYTTQGAWVYHYATDQWTGPNCVLNQNGADIGFLTSAVVYRRQAGDVRHLLAFYSNPTGELWLGDTYGYEDGMSIPNPNNNQLSITTRDIYLGEMGKETAVQGIFLYTAADPHLIQPFVVGVTQLYANTDSVSEDYPVSAIGGLGMVPTGAINSDGLRVSVTVTDTSGPRAGLTKLVFQTSSEGDTTLNA